MTWHERITVLVIIAVFLCGFCVGVSERADRIARRRVRLIERMARQRNPW